MSEKNYLQSALSRQPRPASKEVREARIFELDITEVRPDPTQPRRYFGARKMRSLAESITKHGQLVAIKVQRLPEGGYQIVDGERRWRAMTELGMRKIEATFRDVADEARTLREQLATNIENAPMSDHEIALGILRLVGYRLKLPELSETIAVLYTLEAKAQKRVLGVRKRHVLAQDEEHIVGLLDEFDPKKKDPNIETKPKEDPKTVVRRFVASYVRPLKMMLDFNLFEDMQRGVIGYEAAKLLIKVKEANDRNSLLELARSNDIAALAAEVERVNANAAQKKKPKRERDVFASKIKGLIKAPLGNLSQERKKRALRLISQLEKVLYEEVGGEAPPETR